MIRIIFYSCGPRDKWETKIGEETSNGNVEGT